MRYNQAHLRLTVCTVQMLFQLFHSPFSDLLNVSNVVSTSYFCFTSFLLQLFYTKCLALPLLPPIPAFYTWCRLINLRFVINRYLWIMFWCNRKWLTWFEFLLEEFGGIVFVFLCQQWLSFILYYCHVYRTTWCIIYYSRKICICVIYGVTTSHNSPTKESCTVTHSLYFDYFVHPVITVLSAVTLMQCQTAFLCLIDLSWVLLCCNPDQTAVIEFS